jgi:hypothetical protein
MSQSEVVDTFAFYGALLVAKTLIMATLTAKKRFEKNVRTNAMESNDKTVQ